MKNEQMTFADLKLLEKDLHRELTNEEAVLAYQAGWRTLLEHLGLDDENYVAYRRLLDLLITYCTKSDVEFETLKRSKDHESAIALLAEFAEACDLECAPFDYGEEEENEELEDPYVARNGGMTVDEVSSLMFDQLPEMESDWVELYKEADPEMEVFAKFVSDLYYDDEPHDPEEAIGDALDMIKDFVVENIAARLAKGEKFDLPYEVLEEVMEYIDSHWTNYSMQVRNKHIECKKY